MNKQFKLLFITILAVTLCVVAACLSACIHIPSNDDTVKNNLEVKFDESHIIYEGDNVDSLRPYLEVIYTDKEGKSTIVTDYVILGDLVEDVSKLTFKYANLTCTIMVKVKENSEIPLETYTVTFKADGKTVSTQNYTIENKQITEPRVPAKTGYTGTWEYYFLTTGNITVNAVYTEKQYNVTLNYNGATGGNTQQTLTVAYDQPIGTLPTPTKTGYEFAGWKHEWNTVTSSTVWKTDSNAIFVAQWNKILFPTEGLKYSLNSDGNSYSVTGIGTVTETDILIPSTYDGKPVTGIGNSAFNNCRSLTSITIPDSITFIGDKAFYYCNSLKSVKFADNSNCESIGDSAFYNCSSLSNITFGSNVQNINQDAFYGCRNLTSITMPNSVTSIGYSAFEGCTGLETVVIGDNVTTISTYAFYGCSNISNIDYLGTIESWCKIQGLGNLMEYGSSSKTLKLNGESITELVIPSGITSIPNYAFAGTNITSVTMSNSVTSISDNAFEGCTGLETVVIGDNVTTISTYAFYGCSNISNIDYLGTIESWCKIQGLGNLMEYGLSSKTLKLNGESVTELVIPSGITSIPNYAFARTNITSVTIPDSVTSIGESAFKGCSSISNVNYLGTMESWCKTQGLYNLMYDGTENKTFSLQGNVVTNLVIPDTVTSISFGAFAGTNITSVIIPHSVISIEESVFFGCRSLASVTIGSKVQNIGSTAFYNCSKLTSITIPESVITIGEGAFYGCRNITNVNYLGTIESWCSIQSTFDLMYYSSANKTFSLQGNVVTNLVIPDAITDIPGAAFYGCKDITNVIISQGVINIGAYAFYGCGSLTTVTIPDSVTFIGNNAFKGCDNLQYNEYDNALYLGDENNAYTVLIKPKDLFITSCTIPENTKLIFGDTFWGCAALTIYCETVSKPSSWDRYWNRLNYSEDCLVIWDCRNNDKDDDGYAYTVISGIRYKLKNNEATVARQPRNITEANIPQKIVYKDREYTVTNIGEMAFYRCSLLTSVTIPANITSIGNTPFVLCHAITFYCEASSKPNGWSDTWNLVDDFLEGPVVWNCNNNTKDSDGYEYAVINGIRYKLKDNEATVAKQPSNITEVNIPQKVVYNETEYTVTSIDILAFYTTLSNDNNLTSVIIPDSVTSIGPSAFSNCKKLTNVSFTGTIEQWNSITKDENWNRDITATKVICSDGEVKI